MLCCLESPQNALLQVGMTQRHVKLTCPSAGETILMIEKQKQLMPPLNWLIDHQWKVGARMDVCFPQSAAGQCCSFVQFTRTATSIRLRCFAVKLSAMSGIANSPNLLHQYYSTDQYTNWENIHQQSANDSWLGSEEVKRQRREADNSSGCLIAGDDS